jgi:hypothetical protein
MRGLVKLSQRFWPLALVICSWASATDAACLDVGRTVIRCLSNGLYVCSMQITNRDLPSAGYLALNDLPAGTAVFPSPILPLPASLAPGQSATMVFQFTAVGPTNLSLRLTLHDAEFVECCVRPFVLVVPECKPVLPRLDLLRTTPNGQGRDVELILDTPVGHLWRLQATDAIETAHWETLPVSIEGDNLPHEISVHDHGGANRFFRLRGE